MSYQRQHIADVAGRASPQNSRFSISMLQVVSFISTLLVFSRADIADDRTLVSIRRANPFPRFLQAGSTLPFVDVGLVPDMLATHTGARRLCSTEQTVAACLSNGAAVRSLATLGVQIINTASANCNATREDMCQYLAGAAETLRLQVLCEPNYAMELSSGGVKEVVLDVNDKFAGRQWNLASIGMKEAWQALKGRPLREVVLAVIDSGVDFRHEDLAGNVFSYENCFHGYNFYDNNNDVSDAEVHGTGIAGILGAVTNNGIGVAGIAPVKIVPVKVFGSGPSGSGADIVKGLDYAIEHGADLSTHSYGGKTDSLILGIAIEIAALRGHLVVAAAGNKGSDISVNKEYPCAWTEQVEMLCVASSDRYGHLASSSNYAPYVDIAAPGDRVFTTKPGNKYGSFSGTSFAVPHVAGAAALLYGLGLSGADVRRSLLASVGDLTDRSGHKIAAYGRLNVAKAIEVAFTKPTVAPKERRSVGNC